MGSISLLMRFMIYSPQLRKAPRMSVIGWSLLELQAVASRSRSTNSGSSLTPTLKSSKSCFTRSTMCIPMPRLVESMWRVKSKRLTENEVIKASLTSGYLYRYHVPSSVREHIDYITPGIALREVTGVQVSTDRLKKRSANGVPPILEPILLPIETLLSGLSSFCSLAITPQCIQGM
jgi:hypothetical protein